MMGNTQCVTETPTAVLILAERSLAEAGRHADSVAATSTFARYRERKAHETIRRHRADITLFTSYLMQIPGMHALGDLFHDPCAWTGMTKGLIEGFVLWQLQQGYAISSVNMRLSTIKLYSRLAQGAGTLDEEHAAMIRTVMGYRGREGKRIDATRPVTQSGREEGRAYPAYPCHKPKLWSTSPILLRGDAIAY